MRLSLTIPILICTALPGGPQSRLLILADAQNLNQTEEEAGVAGVTEGGCSDCDGCPDSSRVYVGTTETITSPACPEGSVATVTSLRTIDDNGEYEILTWNTGSLLEDLSMFSPYIYRRASLSEDTSCFELDESVLPVVGDQTEIRVTLNCERLTYCDFRWDVKFGCAETGVTITTSDESGGGGGVQVLSDVDDTIVCSSPSATCDSLSSCTAEGSASASAYLAGVDRRLDSHEFYPGVAELMLGLALGPGTSDDGGSTYFPAKPMMLSARPREAKGFLSIDQDSDLNIRMESIGRRNNNSGTWGVNVDESRYGTIFDGINFKEFGQTKATHYEELSKERPTTRFAFLGDDGQGDLCAAQSMLESESSERMMAVLLHRVLEDPADIHVDCESPGGEDFTLNLPEGDKVHHFRTYSDAALWSLERDMISCCSASNVLYAIEEWIACRCNGDCPVNGLGPPGGVSEKATRVETLVYCNDLEADRVPLQEAVMSCDPEEKCSNPKPFEKPRSAATGLGAGSVLKLAFGLLLSLVIMLY